MRLLTQYHPVNVHALPSPHVNSLVRIPLLIPFFLIPMAASNAASVIQAVTDAASYAPRVAPGSLATIFGTGLSNSTLNASGFPLPQTLGGTSVFVSQSQVTTQVPLVYASPTQINFQVPSRLIAGTAAMYITLGGGQSLVFNFTVVTASPGFFQNTSNHAAAQNADHSANSSSNAAAEGSVVVVYLTGQGPVDHPVADGTPAVSSPLAHATSSVTATLGGVAAPVQFLGLSPGYAGLAQANIQIPSMASGDYPLVLTVGGFVSASAVLSVSGSGTKPPNFLSLVGKLSFGNSGMSSVAILGNTTYVCGADRIIIIDTSDVTKPLYDGEFGDATLNGNGGKCVVNTSTSTPILVDLLGPGSAPNFAVYNVATATQPVLLGEIAPQNYTFLADLTFVGTTGFSSTNWFAFNGANDITTQHGDFLSFDFSSLVPQLISAMVPNSGQPASNNLNPRPNALALPPSFQLVYVASTTATGSSTVGNAALDVINVSNVQSMQGADRVTVSEAAIFLGMAYDNRLLLLTGNTTSFRNPGVPDFNFTGKLTLTTMDVSNVPNPQPIKTVVTDIQTTGTYRVEPLGSSVFAIVNNPPETDPTGPASLMIVDARNSKAPVLYPYETQFGLSGIAASNGYFLAPNQNGLNIYKISIP
jgi:uncharacterized protein (TIGR03437 family)